LRNRGPKASTLPHQISTRLTLWLSVFAVLVVSLLMVRQELDYNQVFDESAHIACGMEWLSVGTYNYEALHPPLARAATAFPLFLIGLRSQGHEQMAVEGSSLLNSGNYRLNLLLARLGVMPFFWLTNLLIYLWVRKHFNALAALLAVTLFSFCPPVLGHSALATTDAPFMAMYLLATFSFAHVCKRPTPARGALAGLCFGLALMSKFTALPFLVVTSMPLLIWFWRSGQRLRSLIAPAAVGFALLCLTIWATYHFSIGTFFTPANIYPKAAAKLSTASPIVQRMFLHQRMPAPDFFRGLYSAFLAGAKQKREGYIFGHTYFGGRWYFFPVAVLAKIPIAMLLLAALGFWTILKRGCRVSFETAVLIGGFAGPMVIAIFGDINLGLRHVLPMCPFLAMIAAIAAARLIGHLPNPHEKPLIAEDLLQEPSLKRGAWVALLLVGWQVTSCVIATPQFIPYFNEAFRPIDSFTLVDSDLDWGQDFYHLEQRLKDVNPNEVSYAYFGDGTILHHQAAEWRVLEPNARVVGWVAVSESTYRRQASDFSWLKDRPFERVGHSIRLYHVLG
jgi:4-amino-4-deoxy-L-arabinose transferase-like glycosyltransferase